jgi:hypothetical protein
MNWKEAVMAQTEVLPRYFLGGIEEIQGKYWGQPVSPRRQFKQTENPQNTCQ